MYYTFYYGCKMLNVLNGGKKYGFWTDLFTPKQYFFTPWQYILLFATVIELIAYTIYNNTIINKKSLLAAPPPHPFPYPHQLTPLPYPHNVDKNLYIF